jgi:hypothetical protein
MDTKNVFDDFVNDMQTAFPDVTFAISENIDEAVQDIESTFFPHVMQIVKRDPEFFSETRMILGMNISMFWSLADKDETRDMIWKNILVCMTASLLHGDIKSKFTRILDIAKSVWTGSGQQNDEVTRILNDENSESRLKEIFDYVMDTRIAKVFMEIMETFDPADLEVDISNPQQLIEILQNPEHPLIQKIITKLQKTLADKLRRGAFTQEQFQREIETIKAKITSVFGGMFNDMLGGQKSSVPASVLMGNSPEARRQRMKARLEKKVRDKK